MCKGIKAILVFVTAFSFGDIWGGNASFVEKNPQNKFPVADYFFSTSNFKEALPEYLNYYKEHSENVWLNYKIGVCYLKTFPKAQALAYLEKVYNLDPIPFTDIHFLLGMAYQYNYDFEEALTFYRLHLERIEDGEDYETTEKRIHECESGIETQKGLANVVVRNSGQHINTSEPEYRPVYYDGMLFFTSRRKNAFYELRDNSNYFYEDIFMANRPKSRPKRTQIKGMALQHSALAYLSAQGTAVLYLGDKGNGDLYMANLQQNQLGQPKPLNNINTKYSETTAVLSKQGDTIYFVSNRPDMSLGAKDILFSVKKDDDSWGKPKNLGLHINTIYDEEGLSLSPNGDTLFFSSKGHNSIGGYDVFMVIKDRNGEWGLPFNLGMPVNSPYDDVFFFYGDAQTAYLSSDRHGSKGSFDIFMAEFNLPEKTDAKLSLENFEQQTELPDSLSDDVTIKPKNTLKDFVEINIEIEDEQDSRGTIAVEIEEDDAIILPISEESPVEIIID